MSRKILHRRFLMYLGVASLFAMCAQAAETQIDAPDAPNWGKDLTMGTLLKPGISVNTMGALKAPSHAKSDGNVKDGDFVLKLFDTRIPKATNVGERISDTDLSVYRHHQWDIGSIGNVYGLTIDNARNIYATSSVNYGTTYGGADAAIGYGAIGDGTSNEIGNNNDDDSVDPNRFGASGVVYKIDKGNGDVSVFAKLPQTKQTFKQQSCEEDSDVTVDRNTGLGLGNIAYDATHNQFFVSDFSDGKIYRIDADGTVEGNYTIDGYDGLSMSDNKTSGKAPYGLAVSPDGKKLYVGTVDFDTYYKPHIFAIELDKNGKFTNTIIDQDATLVDDLKYTQNIGGIYAGKESDGTGPVWAAYSDLQFTPNGELMVGVRAGCKGTIASSYNHGGTVYLLKKDNNGKYNQADDKLPGSTSYSGEPDGTNNRDSRAGAGRYDEGALPIYVNIKDDGDGVGELNTGPSDGYGGVSIYDTKDGNFSYFATYGDNMKEVGYHGFVSFPSDFDLNTSSESIITPMTTYRSLPSSNKSGTRHDYKGIGGDIEVLSVQEDWGDAPDSYGTSDGENGPHHIIKSDAVYLGRSVDAEPNGKPSVDANGDDNDVTPDDEDGITLHDLEQNATSYTIKADDIYANNGSGDDVTIHAWIDFNGNGKFDSDEYASTTVKNGEHKPTSDLVWSGLSGLKAGYTYARFRITNDNNIDENTPTGQASDGEVEDYKLYIKPIVGVGSLVWNDTNNNGIQDANESGIDGVTVKLLDSNGNELKSTTTADGGKYSFCGLDEGSYKVQVSLNGYLKSSKQTSSTNDGNDSDSNIASEDDNAYTTATIDLRADQEPTGELSLLTTSDSICPHIPDGNSDATIDFGFYIPVPKIDVEKWTNGVQADNDNGSKLHVGDKVTWTYLIKNIGTEDLNNVKLVDDKEGNINCSKDTLAVDENITCTKTSTVPESQLGEVYENIASVSAKGVITGKDVNDSDPSHYYVPAVAVGSLVWSDANHNGKQDANEAGIEGVTVNLLDSNGKTIKTTTTDKNGKYCFCKLYEGDYKVQVDMSKVPGYRATDNQVANANSDKDNDSNIKDANESSKIYTSSVITLSEGGEPTGENSPISGSDDSSSCNLPDANKNSTVDFGFFNPDPKIDIEKHTNGKDADDANGDDVPVVLKGSTVTWTYIVKNIGAETLNSISVKDNQEGDISCPKTTLAVGESMTCEANATAIDGLYENNSTVTAVGKVSGKSVSDKDPSHYRGVDPKIDIEKSTNGKDADDANGTDVPHIALGHKVTWKYVVTNIGDEDLKDIKVTDNKIPTLKCSKDYLAVGESMSCEATGVATKGLYENNSTVVGVGVHTGKEVSDKDPSHYIGVDEPASIGDRVWYDDDKDGIQGYDELGVKGVTVELLDCNGKKLQTTKTDSDGKYLFDNLAVGDYKIKFLLSTLPDGFNPTIKDTKGSDADDSDAEVSTGVTECTNLSSGESDLSWDMGVISELYMIGTTFWVDLDHNNVYNKTVDEPIDGAKVELLDADGNKLYWTNRHLSVTTTDNGDPIETVTKNGGQYRFYVPAGKYRVRFHMPKKYKDQKYHFVKADKNSDDDTDINKADETGTTDVVEVGPNTKSKDLTLDAGIECPCADLKSARADAFTNIGLVVMILGIMFMGFAFREQEEMI